MSTTTLEGFGRPKWDKEAPPSKSTMRKVEMCSKCAQSVILTQIGKHTPTKEYKCECGTGNIYLSICLYMEITNCYDELYPSHTNKKNCVRVVTCLLQKDDIIKWSNILYYFEQLNNLSKRPS